MTLLEAHNLAYENSKETADTQYFVNHDEDGFYAGYHPMYEGQSYYLEGKYFDEHTQEWC